MISITVWSYPVAPNICDFLIQEIGHIRLQVGYIMQMTNLGSRAVMGNTPFHVCLHAQNLVCSRQQYLRRQLQAASERDARAACKDQGTA